MLSGARAFGGDHAADTISSVMRAEPKWQLLPPDTPAAVRRLLRRCPEKDPRSRLRDIGDARIEIREAVSAATPDDAATPDTLDAPRTLAFFARDGQVPLQLLLRRLVDVAES